MVDSRRPTNLILVNGSPGSGKTTLAKAIGEHFSYPVLARDALKETLFEVTPPQHRSASRRLGVASWHLLYEMLDTLIDRVPGIVVDSNFSHGIAEEELLPRLAKCSAVIVHCSVPWHVIEHRIKARNLTAGRHPGHFDLDALPEVEQAFRGGRYQHLDLPVPTIPISTLDGYMPSFQDLVSTLRERLNTKATTQHYPNRGS